MGPASTAKTWGELVAEVVGPRGNMFEESFTDGL